MKKLRKKGPDADDLKDRQPRQHSNKSVSLDKTRPSRRSFLALVSGGFGFGVLGGITVENFELKPTFNVGNDKDAAPASESLAPYAEINFPIADKPVPRTIHLRGTLRNVKESDYLYAEIENGVPQYHYRDVSRLGIKFEKEIFHLGKEVDDVGKPYRVQMFVSPAPISPEAHLKRQPGLPIGEPVTYTRRASTDEEKEAEKALLKRVPPTHS
jgi:hypothetical protein